MTVVEDQLEVRRHEAREYILEMIEELALMALQCGESHIAMALDNILSETTEAHR